jgi:hypothetical protein
MNLKQTFARASKISARTLKLRDKLWPNLDILSLWNRTKKAGFTTMPRPMPHIFHILDDLAPKGKPISRTYLCLWCRVFDESVVEVKYESSMAFEAGFTGQRAVTTWHSRMKILVDLGFIYAKPGSAGKYQYILILNPYLIIKELYKSKQIPEQLFIELFTRTQEVGADEDL